MSRRVLSKNFTWQKIAREDFARIVSDQANYEGRARDRSIVRSIIHANGNRLASFEWGMSAKMKAPLEFPSRYWRIRRIYRMPRLRLIKGFTTILDVWGRDEVSVCFETTTWKFRHIRDNHTADVYANIQSISVIMVYPEEVRKYRIKFLYICLYFWENWVGKFSKYSKIMYKEILFFIFTEETSPFLVPWLMKSPFIIL